MKDACKSLIENLEEQGFLIEEVSDLYNKKYNYKVAIPTLISYLDRDLEPALMEEIVRSLTVKWAKPDAALPLVKLFPRVKDDSGLGLRWVIGNALAVVADDSVFDDVVSLIRKKAFGRSREMLVHALFGMKRAGTDEILIELLDDEDLVGHALTGIRKRKIESALEKVLLLGQHEKTWVRSEAKKTLAKLSDKGK